VIHGVPSSRIQVLEYVNARVPEIRRGRLKTAMIFWAHDVYLIALEEWFVIHDRRDMRGPFNYNVPAEVEDGLKKFFQALYN
jgi:hypothetical protein